MDVKEARMCRSSYKETQKVPSPRIAPAYSVD